MTDQAETGNAEQAVIDAVKAFGEALTEIGRQTEEAARQFAAAMRERYAPLLDALESPAPALPEEPPIGAIVIDTEGDFWRRLRGDSSLWRCSEDGVHLRPWDRLVREFGPLTRLVPEMESFPRDLALKLVEVLRESLPYWDPSRASVRAYNAATDVLARATAALTDTTSTKEAANA